MKLGETFFSLFFFLITTGLAVAGTALDDFEDGVIDEEMWIPTFARKGSLKEVNGRLEMDEKGDAKWDCSVGVRFVPPIDITKGKLTISFDAFAGTTELGVYFNNSPDVPANAALAQRAPVFNFFVSETTWTRQILANSDITFEPVFSYQLDVESPNHYKIELSPTNKPKKSWSYYTSINEDEFEAEGKIRFGAVNPNEVYIYFNPCYGGAGRNELTWIDNVSITSPSITDMGVQSVGSAGKLATTWATLKRE